MNTLIVQAMPKIQPKSSEDQHYIVKLFLFQLCGSLADVQPKGKQKYVHIKKQYRLPVLSLHEKLYLKCIKWKYPAFCASCSAAKRLQIREKFKITIKLFFVQIIIIRIDQTKQNQLPQKWKFIYFQQPDTQ